MDMPIRSTGDVKVGELTNALGFLLRLAQLQSFDDFFSGNGPRGVKPGEFSVLWVIGQNPGIRQSVLGQRLMIKRAHMTKLIRAFEDNGLVSRRIPDEDRRAVELTLTAKGEGEIARTAPGFFAYEEKSGAPLTSKERSQLVSLLRKFVGIEEEDRP
ncbi:MarR family transcriptional regulator [Ciceribacter sp. L1K22]|uniref:MarR family winged helix-turn-helix transcriptional regulator n=1 Tax=Ciceribacter sp. L1K22 TaxID=2820275 RepID=UPI001ABE83FB|nr:MarR family transcriptional regulator [Ciceribacter sp. L1K22]MBO3758621.1 MarR family transcriptional regulator [Ciceribacter sp. L1K22]